MTHRTNEKVVAEPSGGMCVHDFVPPFRCTCCECDRRGWCFTRKRMLDNAMFSLQFVCHRDSVNEYSSAMQTLLMNTIIARNAVPNVDALHVCQWWTTQHPTIPRRLRIVRLLLLVPIARQTTIDQFQDQLDAKTQCNALQPPTESHRCHLSSQFWIQFVGLCVRRYRCDFKFEQFIGWADEIDQSLAGWHWCAAVARNKRFKYF